MGFLTLERRNEIKRIVYPLLGRDLLEISRKNGIAVFDVDLNQLGLNPTPSGLIIKVDEGYKILIHNGYHMHRKRFTWAHELGHFFLHNKYLDEQKLITDDDNTLYNRPGYTDLTDDEKRREREANFFAAELLMPEDAVREAYRRDPSLENLAEFFNVSIPAMSYRLKNLSIIKNEGWQEEW